MGPRRKSIIDSHAPEGEDGRASDLRSSLASLADLMKDILSDVAADELSTQKQRTRTASTLAARLGADKVQHRTLLSQASFDAASAGRSRLDSSLQLEGRRRMTLVAAEAARTVEEPDRHCDNGSRSHDVAPAWQEEGRSRGKSVAAEVAELVAFKQGVRERGKSVADEAVKAAIFQGLAVHD